MGEGAQAASAGFIAVAIAITVFFEADVDAQAGAYATGVLAMMTSGAAAVTLTAWRRGSKVGAFAFGLVTVVFVYTLVANEIQRPDGLVIASFFILAIVLTSLVSRVWRTTELRTEKVEIDETAQRFIDEEVSKGEIHIVASRRQSGTEREYAEREERQRRDSHIPADQPILFFEDVLEVKGVEIGDHRVLRAESSTVPNAIAALLLHLRDETGKTPHCYFGWTRGNPIVYLFRYLLFGEGDTPSVTHEVFREVEPDPERRPIIHVGGR